MKGQKFRRKVDAFGKFLKNYFVLPLSRRPDYILNITNSNAHDHLVDELHPYLPQKDLGLGFGLTLFC
jgi:hypothetical protein